MIQSSKSMCPVLGNDNEHGPDTGQIGRVGAAPPTVNGDKCNQDKSKGIAVNRTVVAWSNVALDHPHRKCMP
ncbi:hypothetical protein Ddc_19781 [Ditylenchus destructor]|nr:hypothetical protein Ddc_19781 [Ditylenchus destructor]